MQTVPIRVYEAGAKIMIAAPLPGLGPSDIAVAIDGDHVRIRGAQRGPRQDGINATFGNGVLILAMPMATPGAPDGSIEIALEPIGATRGEHIGHVGRVPTPTTTAEHRRAKHATPTPS